MGVVGGVVSKVCPPQELDQGLPTQRRVRVMRELLEIVGSKRLEEVQLTCTYTAHT